MNVDMLFAFAVRGAVVGLAILIGQGVRILLYARRHRYHCQQRLRRLRR